MKGNIYTDQKCHIEGCGASFKIGMLRGKLQCPLHPEVTWTGKCQVRFGKHHHKRFQSVAEAERHLNKIRNLTDEGTYDKRDFQKNKPLHFKTLRKKYHLVRTKDNISTKQKSDIKAVLKRAGSAWDHPWDHLSIKDITEGEIDDFFAFDHRIIKQWQQKNGVVKTRDMGPVGNKTLFNWKSILMSFWRWVVRREKKMSKLPMPEFPLIKFKSKMRMIVGMEDQQAVFQELHRITWSFNPRIWLGARLMAWYPRVRPGEMRNVLEGDINLDDGWILIRDPKEGGTKYIDLLPEHIKIIKEVMLMSPKGFPQMPFFRHLVRRGKGLAGTQISPKYFNRYWKKACKNIGVEGVTIYPGVKHSTVTALGANGMSPEEIQQYVTGHASDSFKRYFLPGSDQVSYASRKVAEMQFKAGQPPVNLFNVPKNANTMN